MFGPKIQQLARRLVQWLVRPLVASPITPNSLTAIGLLLSCVTAALLGTGHLLTGGIAVLLAGAFDMLDGGLARAKNMQSTFGAFYDSTLDRLSESIIYFGLAAWFLYQGLQAAVLLCFVVIIGSLMISYARARAEGLGLECKVGMLARPERVVLLGAVLILERFIKIPAEPRYGLVMLVLATLAVFSFVTLIHRIWHVWRLTLPQESTSSVAKMQPDSSWSERGTRA